MAHIKANKMKKQVTLMCFLLAGYMLAGAQQNNSYYTKTGDSKSLHQFYRFNPKKNVPLVQGHRGTKEDGIPESCIAALEHVLTKAPAVFEIDPRLTKDSVIVVFHDATLERTTNGTGKLNEYTWEELQKLRLKNAAGVLTDYKINTLAEVLDWARGKTVLILDKKDVPLQMIADIIRRHDANSFVINMVRSTDDALFYYRDEPQRMFSVSIRQPETFEQYKAAGIPLTQMFACVGTEIHAGTKPLCELLGRHGIKSLLATASSYDKLPTPELRAEAYKKVLESGISIVESDYPIELSKTLLKKDKKKR